jgi:hypothetical protein
LVAILDGSRDHRTQVWKGAIQGSFWGENFFQPIYTDYAN